MAERGKKGCIKTSKGPWIVRRITKDGVISQHYRFPSERERQNNKAREQKRRSIARRIFAGLKAHGNYILPKHADTNDLLKALCEEAGWIVEEDGTIYKKETNLGISNLLNKGVEHPIPIDLKDEEYRHCIWRMNCNDIKILIPKINLCAKKYDENVNLELTL